MARSLKSAYTWTLRYSVPGGPAPCLSLFCACDLWTVGICRPSRASLALDVRPDRAIDLHQFHRRAIHFDECNQHTAAWTIRFNDDLAVFNSRFQVVNLKRDMWDSLHKFRNGRTLPVPLPLDAELIVFVVAYGDLKMRQRNFALEGAGGGNANVVVFHNRNVLGTAFQVSNLIVGSVSRPPASGTRRLKSAIRR